MLAAAGLPMRLSSPGSSGKSGIVGCERLLIRENQKDCRLGDRRFHEGDVISLDGQTGMIYAGRVEFVEERPTEQLSEVERWRIAHD